MLAWALLADLVQPVYQGPKTTPGHDLLGGPRLHRPSRTKSPSHQEAGQPRLQPCSLLRVAAGLQGGCVAVSWPLQRGRICSRSSSLDSG